VILDFRELGVGQIHVTHLTSPGGIRASRETRRAFAMDVGLRLSNRYTVAQHVHAVVS